MCLNTEGAYFFIMPYTKLPVYHIHLPQTEHERYNLQFFFLALCSFEAAVCGAVELHSFIPRGVSNILCTPFISLMVDYILVYFTNVWARFEMTHHS